MAFTYSPVFRVRQQEIDVLTNFEFESAMCPLLEIVKAKDRTNNKLESTDIYNGIVQRIHAEKVMVDLPIYLTPTVSTSQEVQDFYRSTIANLKERIDFYLSFSVQSGKVIPVISSLKPETGEDDTLLNQFSVLSTYFPVIAVRIFFKHFDESLAELSLITLRPDDIILYDLDSSAFTNPLVVKQSNALKRDFAAWHTCVIRSAISSTLQNKSLDHCDVVGEADNSLLQLYSTKFHSFGDYVGIKKDEISAGGGISPGFIIYDPIDNLFYGFRAASQPKGISLSLSEFEDRIVPDVLNAPFMRAMSRINPNYLNHNNKGYQRLLSISHKHESGKSQAKFKWISMQHYLHCLKVSLML